MRRVIAWVILGVLVSAPAAAQSWETKRSTDDFAGETSISARGRAENRALMIDVDCYETGEFMVTVTNTRRLAARSTVMSAIFPRDGEVRWDGGEVERFYFNIGEGDEAAFVSKLVAHRELAMRVGGRSGTTDQFDLTGAADALAELECAP